MITGIEDSRATCPRGDSLVETETTGRELPHLPRSGLLAPRLSGVGLPVSVSELVSDVDTEAPDSVGGFP